MAKTHIQTFMVEGRFPFPLDMLRYDHCYPVTEAEDSYNIGISIRRENDRPLQIKLRRHVENASVMPTTGRWASFNWTVLEHTIKTESY